MSRERAAKTTGKATEKIVYRLLEETPTPAAGLRDLHDTNTWHAWSSLKSISMNNSYSIYAKADGTEVRVTEVTKKTTPTSMWPDLEYQGIVEKWVRNES